MSRGKKKNELGNGEGGTAAILSTSDGYNKCDSCEVGADLKEIKSTLNEVMGVLKQFSGGMRNMQGEITKLTKKCNQMDNSIHRMHNQCDNVNREVTRLTKNCNGIGMCMQREIGEIKQLKKQCKGMEKSIQKANDKIITSAECQMVLLKNQKWEYSAPRPFDFAHMDDDGEEAEVFLEQIEDYTKKMRYGTGDGDIYISADIGYDEEFLPHWNEFAMALLQYRHCLKCTQEEESSFRLSNVELPDNVIDLLSDALKTTHFHKFVLQDNEFESSKGIDFALEYLQRNRILKDFTLYDNPIHNMKYIKRLCRIISKHPSIKTFGLTGIHVEHQGIDTYKMLCSIMKAGQTKLVSIDLSENDIETGRDMFISGYLRSNSVLESLDLSGNLLNDDDATAIAEALKYKNRSLRDLDLTSNHAISASGWRALHLAVYDDTNLNSMADCNHICCIEFPSTDEYLDMSAFARETNGSDPDSNFYYSTDSVRQKKIYHVLSIGNLNCSNVKNFDDMPFELLPDLLCSIQEYSNYHVSEDTPDQSDDDVKPLSLVYEICRYWDECLIVYETLGSS